MKGKIIDYVENLLLHTGSAFAGDTCCNNRPHMTWLARATNAVCGPMNWTEELEFGDTQTRVRFVLFAWFTKAGIKWVDLCHGRQPITEELLFSDEDCNCPSCSAERRDVNEFEWNR